MYFIGILEKVKTGQFDDDTFVPDRHNWEQARLWYLKHSFADEISNKELLDLLYFFYVHENLDVYDNVHFSEVAESIYEKYKIEKKKFLQAFLDFRKLVYEI